MHAWSMIRTFHHMTVRETTHQASNTFEVVVCPGTRPISSMLDWSEQSHCFRTIFRCHMYSTDTVRNELAEQSCVLKTLGQSILECSCCVLMTAQIDDEMFYLLNDNFVPK